MGLELRREDKVEMVVAMAMAVGEGKRGAEEEAGG
jgi:hypothetical protein